MPDVLFRLLAHLAFMGSVVLTFFGAGMVVQYCELRQGAPPFVFGPRKTLALGIAMLASAAVLLWLSLTPSPTL